MKEARISVIVPAKTSERIIDKCLGGVLDQEYARYEVIVLTGLSCARIVIR